MRTEKNRKSFYVLPHIYVYMQIYINEGRGKEGGEEEERKSESETANLPEVKAPRRGAMLYKYPN